MAPLCLATCQPCVPSTSGRAGPAQLSARQTRHRALVVEAAGRPGDGLQARAAPPAGSTAGQAPLRRLAPVVNSGGGGGSGATAGGGPSGGVPPAAGARSSLRMPPNAAAGMGKTEDWLDLLQTPEPDMFGARARSASDAAVLRRKGHLKEQDSFIQFVQGMHQTHTTLEVGGCPPRGWSRCSGGRRARTGGICSSCSLTPPVPRRQVPRNGTLQSVSAPPAAQFHSFAAHAMGACKQVMQKMDRWIAEHRAEPRTSRLRRMVPTIGSFFVPLKCAPAAAWGWRGGG